MAAESVISRQDTVLDRSRMTGWENETSFAGPSKSQLGMTVAKSDKDRKIGHRRVDEAGQVTYKKTTTSELMSAIQLGIGQSVGRLAPKARRDVLYSDFHIVETVDYPHEGGAQTPAHHCSDFSFKTYAPVAFQYFRELFGIQSDDYMLSLCNEPLRELSNPGASGSIFYITNDDEFIIKTVQHKEADFLQKLLPGYYMNLNQNRATLLPKFYGLYCYQCGGKNIRFAVMNNLLPSSVHLHAKYDLKGSTYKRRASNHERTKSSPTYKDLDFIELNPEGIFLDFDTHEALKKTIDRDCRVLQSFKIMDYSMLLGVHNIDQAAKDKANSCGAVLQAAMAQAAGENVNNDQDKGIVRSKSMRHRLAQFSTALESIQLQSESFDMVDGSDIAPGGIPAKNGRGDHLLLYVGIIDILQSYRLTKKLEHTFKAMVTDGDTISVHRPGFYAQRFQQFILSDSVFRKMPTPDPSQSRSSRVRFRKLVQLALRHSPSKRKSMVDRQKSLIEANTTVNSKDITAVTTITTTTTTLSDVDQGAVGGRPDVLLTTNAVLPVSAAQSQPTVTVERSPREHRTTASTSLEAVATVEQPTRVTAAKTTTNNGGLLRGSAATGKMDSGHHVQYKMDQDVVGTDMIRVFVSDVDVKRVTSLNLSEAGTTSSGVSSTRSVSSTGYIASADVSAEKLTSAVNYRSGVRDAVDIKLKPDN